jgi:hypothetical protein
VWCLLTGIGIKSSETLEVRFPILDNVLKMTIICSPLWPIRFERIDAGATLLIFRFGKTVSIVG